MRYLLLLLFSILFSCNNNSTVSELDEVNNNIYRNHHDSVSYVGKETCKTCHFDIYNSFMQTGMGKSFSIATKTKSVLDENNNPLIYDTIKDLFYQPLWKEDSLYLLEFRMKGKDTSHKFLQKIDYVIGSGHHTNSHIFSINGYLHQMPYTFYTQERRADLPPGYENGNNSRFSREIGMECMSCHNAYPKYENKSLNKYHSVLEGIDCERCHGPGEIHVKEKMSGIIIDTSKYVDYSIVNPSKLEKELQFDVCSRCHLQGTTVLKNGKNWNDFVPGTSLSETMETFVPRFENDESFIMASHVDRLQQSDCYKIGGVNCISCHNPHKSVTSLPGEYFNSKCTDCHLICEDKEYNKDCISCHMSKSSSTDIPHVSITDHKISIPKHSDNKKGEFQSLVCVNNPNPSSLSKAKAYLKHYESFDKNSILLDSAIRFLKLSKKEESVPFFIQYFYLRKQYKELIKFSESVELVDFHNTFNNNILGLMYLRMGDAYSQFNFNEKAYYNFLKSLEFSPFNLDYQLKTAVLEIKMSKFEIARNRLLDLVKLYPNFDKAYYNLGLIYLNVDKDLHKAKDYMKKAIELNPDYKLAKDNLDIIEKKHD